MKKYFIVYPVAVGVSSIAAFLVSLLTFKVGVMYSVFFGMIVGGFAALVSRVVLHLVDKDNAPKTWQITIYGVVAEIGWILAVFCESWTWATLFTSIFACGLLLCFGTRWLEDKDGNGIPDIFEKKKEVKGITREWCYEHLLFKFKDDVVGAEVDEERPVCLVDGVPMTVNEARKVGREADANDSSAYIDSLVK